MEVEVPHVVILPFPAQGHVKPLFMLAKLICHAGLDVTFVNTHHSHTRILHLIDQPTFYNLFPRFRFISIPDGLPPEHPRTGPRVTELFDSIRSVSKPSFKDLMLSLRDEEKPPSCIIADGIMSFAIDVAEELHIPVITFRTYNATCTWVYFHLHKLIQIGEIPLLGDVDMDRQITCIPGLETFMRRRDLPSFCRLEIENPFLQFLMGQTSKMTRASALILNTFEELEHSMVSQLRSIFPKIYTVGPLHGLLESRISHSPPSDSSNGSLRQQDRTCMTWLDSQPSKSVIYVSFGSVVSLTRDELMEFWYGLVNSEKSFLWVERQGLSGETPPQLMMGAQERGYIVSWAPQEEVLAHKAIGGFLTHSGWNSNLESIWAGVPMICWPKLFDQPVNSRCVSEMWGIGLDMKDTCDRATVEKIVRDVMEGNKKDIMKSSVKNASMAHDSVSVGGSSYRNIEILIEDLKSMNSAKCA